MRISFMQKFPNGEPTYFKEKILSINNPLPVDSPLKFGSACKIHTIRESALWQKRVGKELECFHWVGKPYKKESHHNVFATVKFVSVQRIVIDSIHEVICVDGKFLDATEAHQLMVNDGFKDEFDFFGWFNKNFYGYILHFTDLKY